MSTKWPITAWLPGSISVMPHFMPALIEVAPIAVRLLILACSAAMFCEGSITVFEVDGGHQRLPGTGTAKSVLARSMYDATRLVCEKVSAWAVIGRPSVVVMPVWV